MAKDKYEIFMRDSNRITVSEFSEANTLKKYNFDPNYQRDYNVWDDGQQSYLLDTIFKNYPMPPIFLETKIVNRKSIYDVVDGKQRLTSIIRFLNNEIALPADFGSDSFGYRELDSKTLDEIEKLATKNAIAKKYLDNFWRYKISVEYIEDAGTKVVEAIFDRLNRGGERLSPAELRKATYHDTIFYNLVDELSNLPYWSKLLDRQPNIDKRRLHHHSFIAELLFVIIEKQLISSYESTIDELYNKWSDMDETQMQVYRTEFITLTNLMESFQIDFTSYKVRGVSHLYALWAFLYYIYNNFEKESYSELASELTDMYSAYSDKVNEESLIIYKNTMQSASKSKTQRKRRVKAIADYLGYEFDDQFFILTQE